MKGHARFREIQLQNNYGISDQAVINEAEALFTTMAAIQGMPKGNFDINHLKAIHKHILGDMYPWAGQFRTTKQTIGDGYAQTTTPPSLLEMEVTRLLSSMKSELSKPQSIDQFADKMAGYYTKLYALSPFPDGNARTARFLIDAVAESQHMQVSWGQIPAEAFHSAVQQALGGSHSGIKAVFRSITDHQDLYALHSVDAIQETMGNIVRQAGLRQDYIPSQSIVSQQDLCQLARYVKQRLAEDLRAFSQGGSTMRDWEITSIQHELTGRVDRQATGPDALARAMSSIQQDKPRTRGPGL